MLEFRRNSVSVLVAAAAMAILPCMAYAQPVELTEADLRQLLPGAVIELDTPVGIRLPITFTGDGLMSGEAGRLEPYLGTARDRGRWWVSDGKLCQKWFRWLDAKPRCARIMRAGDRVLWQEDGGEKGTGTIVAEAAGQPQLPAKESTRPIVASIAPAAPQRVAPIAPPRTEAARPAEQRRPPLAARAKEAPGHGAPHYATPALAAIVKRAAEPRVQVAAPAETAPAEDRRLPAAGPVPRRVAQQSRPFNPPIPLPTRRVVEAPVPPPAPFALALSASGGTFRVRGVTSDDVLNVRRGPSDEHPIVGGLRPGSGNIRIVGRCVEAWCEVAAPRTAGWVNVLFLAPERAAPRYRFDPFRQGLGGPFMPGS